MSVLTSPQPLVLSSEEGERISIPGTGIVFKSPSAEGEEWTVLHYTLGPNQFGAPLHYHRELIETFFILSGELWMRVGDQEVNAGPGHFVLVNPGTLHSFANRTDQPVKLLAHASRASHKAFLMELFDMVRTSPSWPPSDPTKLIELGARYDSYFPNA
jgi:mannose-6-phosphate isomerase-like protein (cupin superfamily)